MSSADAATVPLGDSFCRARRVFLAVLGAISVVAAVSYWRSFPLVCGEAGVAPIAEVVQGWQAVGWGFFDAPTLLWFVPSDAGVVGLCGLAILAGIALIVGIAPRAAAWLGWGAHLSLFWGMQGQAFMYGWDVLLLESLFLAGFFAPSGLRPRERWGRSAHPAAHWLFRWLLFRLLAQGVWTRLFEQRDLWLGEHKALEFGLFAQPMPTPMAMAFLEDGGAALGALTVGWLVADAVLAVGVLGPRWARRVAAPAIAVVFAGRWLLFHEGWTAPLAMALALLLLDDRILRRREEVAAPRPGPLSGVAWLAAGAFALMTLVQWWAMADPVPASGAGGKGEVLHFVRQFATCNSYPHRVGTAQRGWVLQAQADADSGWHPYESRLLLGRVDKAPAWMPLHVPRLEFALAMSPRPNALQERQPWHYAWLRKVFEGDPAILDGFASRPEVDPWRLRIVNYAYYPAPAGSDDIWQRGPDPEHAFMGPFLRQDVGAGPQ